jgi:hypothetical protein
VKKWSRSGRTAGKRGRAKEEERGIESRREKGKIDCVCNGKRRGCKFHIFKVFLDSK